MTKNIVILAIESSCDDTGAAVIRNGNVLSNCVATQLNHENLGGVVPELASRQHILQIVPIVDKALKTADIDLSEVSAVAMTKGPGLLGSLHVGVSFAKGLALSLSVPLIEVHHMQAHILAHFASQTHPSFPFLNLTVSGGHTEIVLIHSHLDMELVGQTFDDAAGEAFDKIGKMLGLPYPAGPHIDNLAKKGQPKIDFPVPVIADLDFSFSGFKTAVLYYLQKKTKEDKDYIIHHLEDICASVQATIVKILLQKMERAIKKYNVSDIAVSGGVSANTGLRAGFQRLGNTWKKNVFIPPFEYCTDNAAMIGVTGYYKYLQGKFCSLEVAPDPRMKI